MSSNEPTLSITLPRLLITVRRKTGVAMAVQAAVGPTALSM